MLSPADRGDPSIQNGFFDPYPTVSLKQFESLKAHSAGQFTGLAFYVPAPLKVGKHTLMGARTTADIFRLLNEAGRPENWFPGRRGQMADRRREGIRRSCPESR